MNQNPVPLPDTTDESLLSRGLINVLSEYYRSWRHKKSQAAKKVKLTWRERIALLTLSQWMYFAAVILFIFMSDRPEDEERRFLTVGIVAGIGLSREIWNAFHRMWNTTFGKGVFLVLYAATANLALAFAAVKVNAISGIEPAPLRFTLGFTTLIMLPFWIFVASIVIASGLLLVSNVWLLVSMMLRIVRIRLPAHWEDKSFAFISMLLRIFLLPIVIAAMIVLFKPYFKQLSNALDFPDIPIELIKAELSEEEKNEINALIEDEEQDALTVVIREKAANPSSPATSSSVAQPTESEENRTNNASQTAAEPDDKDEDVALVDKMIAAFIFNMETYRYSVCAKAENQRVLTIDENSVLLAERDDSPLGYHFSVAACDHLYNQPQIQAQ